MDFRKRFDVSMRTMTFGRAFPGGHLGVRLAQGKLAQPVPYIPAAFLVRRVVRLFGLLSWGSLHDAFACVY